MAAFAQQKIARRTFSILMVHVATLTGLPAKAELSGMTVTATIEIAAGEGYRGPWQMNESVFNFVDDPTVTLTEDGFAAVAWVDQSRKDVLFQLYAPNGSPSLPEPVNVSRTPRIFSWMPRIAAAPDNPSEFFVLWQEIVFSGGSHGGEIFFSRTTDGGRTFSPPTNLSNTPAGAGKGRLTTDYWHNGSLDLAVDAGSRLYAAWTDYEGTLWFSRSTNRGRSFSRPLRIAGGRRVQAPKRGPSLAIGPENEIYLAWTVGEDPQADLHLTKSENQGRSFATPRIVLGGTDHADAPKVAVDPAGTVHLVYAEGSKGLFGPYRILYSRSTDGGQRFETPREISEPISDEVASSHFPSLSLDAEGNPYVLWELFPRLAHYPVGLALAHSRDGGKSFSIPALVPGTAGRSAGFNGSQQGLLMRKLAVNSAGAIAIVNSTFVPNKSSHIRLLLGTRSED